MAGAFLQLGGHLHVRHDASKHWCDALIVGTLQAPERQLDVPQRPFNLLIAHDVDVQPCESLHLLHTRSVRVDDRFEHTSLRHQGGGHDRRLGVWDPRVRTSDSGMPVNLGARSDETGRDRREVRRDMSEILARSAVTDRYLPLRNGHV
jgi:hypothetical protein